jgi:hypothetical protein
MRECQVHYLAFERMFQKTWFTIFFKMNITVPITFLLGTRGSYLTATL